LQSPFLIKLNVQDDMLILAVTLMSAQSAFMILWQTPPMPEVDVEVPPHWPLFECSLYRTRVQSSSSRLYTECPFSEAAAAAARMSKTRVVFPPSGSAIVAGRAAIMAQKMIENYMAKH
jgi:hypothetical protein